MKPAKQTVYLPVKVEDELPSENESSKVAILHKERGFDFAYYMHKWKSFDHFKQGLSYKQSDITHWLKPQEAFVFTPEQLNEYTVNVIKQALETAAENAFISNHIPDEDDDRVYKEVNKQSITNTFEETFKKFEV